MPQPRSKRYSDQEWEQHRGFVLKRYMHERQNLEQVRKELEERGFSVR